LWVRGDSEWRRSRRRRRREKEDDESVRDSRPAKGMENTNGRCVEEEFDEVRRG